MCYDPELETQKRGWIVVDVDDVTNEELLEILAVVNSAVARDVATPSRVFASRDRDTRYVIDDTEDLKDDLVTF